MLDLLTKIDLLGCGPSTNPMNVSTTQLAKRSRELVRKGGINNGFGKLIYLFDTQLDESIVNHSVHDDHSTSHMNVAH